MDIKPVPAQMIIQMEYEEGFHDGYRQAMREMPEIVRCKDCKQGEQSVLQNRHLWCRIHEFYREPDWFCADGVKKDA